MRARTVSTLLTTILFLIALTPIRHTDAEVTWSDETRLTTYNNWDTCPSIAQMSDGRIWVVWQAKRAQDFDIYYKIYDWTLWTNDRRLLSDLGHDINPSIIQADNGTIWVFWASNRHDNYDIFYKTSSDNGDSWTGSLQLTTDTNDDTSPAAVQDRNGAIWLVWQRDLAANDEIFYRIYNGSWSNEMQLTTDPAVDRLPSITETRDGRIWIFWGSFRAEVFEIFYRIYNGSWSNEMQLTASDKVDIDPTVVQDRNGTIWVVWTSHEPVITWQDDLYYKTSSDNGLTWSDRVQLTSDPLDDMWASIIQVSDKKIWVVWTSSRNDNYDVYYKTSDEIIIHDVAVTGISTNPHDQVYRNETVHINVDVKNKGDFTESFTVTCNVSSTILESRPVTLSAGNSTVLVFEWNTSGYDFGTYIISATASSVPGESLINTADNTLSEGTMNVKIHGDIDGDGQVYIADLTTLGDAYGSTLNGSEWNSEADINRDNIVDVFDLQIVGKNYGKSV